MISINFLPPGYMLSHLPLFANKHFSIIFGGHLEFLLKTQKCIYLVNNVRKSEILTHRLYRVICHFLPKIGVPLFLAAILNFCVKCKMIILEMVRVRKILTKYLANKINQSPVAGLHRPFGCALKALGLFQDHPNHQKTINQLTFFPKQYI